MATLTIKKVPDELYRRLKESAGANRRSINSEAITRLEQSLRHVQTDETDLLDRIRTLRSEFPERLDDGELRSAIAEGQK